MLALFVNKIIEIETKTSQGIRLKCEKYSTTIILIELDAAKDFKLIQLFGQPFIVDKGLLPYISGDTNVQLYIDIMNVEDYQGEFYVTATKCCRFSSGCDHSDLQIETQKSYIVLPSTTYRFKFQMVASQLLANTTGGYCEFSVSQFGVVDLTTRVDLILTTKSPLAVGSEPLDSDKCPDPGYIMYVKDGRRYCKPPCTGERIWDADKMLCLSPNCIALYEGYRNYWNEGTGYCEAVTVCADRTLVYNQLTNSCDQTQSPAPAPTSNNSTDSTNNGSNDDDDDDDGGSGDTSSGGDVSIECGTNGVVTQDRGCECKDGYKTDYSQSPANFVWCGQSVSAPQDPQSGSTDTNSSSKKPTLFQSLKMLPVYLKVIIGLSIGFLVIGVIILVIVTVYCIYRRKKKKTNKKKQNDSSDSDSDESDSELELLEQETIALKQQILKRQQHNRKL
jgi:hypothetical protein